MDDEGRRLLVALRESLAGNLKAAAMTVYPGSSEQDAGSRMAKWWTGTLNPPAAAWALALAGPHPTPLLDVIGAAAGCNWTPSNPATVRAAVRDELATLGARVADALQRMDDADAEERRLLAQHERRGPHRAAPAATTTRRHA